jgi:hypothetical chaperone protein
MGAAGGEQALRILGEAARIAGFDQFEFLEEPVAAALHYHAQSAAARHAGDRRRRRHHRCRPRQRRRQRTPLIHAAWRASCRGSARASPACRCISSSTRSWCRTRRASARSSSATSARYRRRSARLQALQRDGGSTRLYRGVEGMKIELSARETASHCLDYVDPALRISSHRADLEDAGGAFVQGLQGLLREVRAQLGSPPDSLFLTGGMSRAPYLRAAAQAVFPEARRVHGEASLGVVPGLASHGA